MNHFELLTLIQSFRAVFTFLLDRGLLSSKRDCQCGTEMVLKERKNAVDGYIWKCPVDSCRKRRSIRVGSFFEDSKIPLGQWIYIIYLLSIDVPSERLSMMTGLSLRMVETALEKLRMICSLKILHGNIKMGGRGKTFEIDMFRIQPKNRSGHGANVFGMVERGTGRSLM